LGDWRSKDNKMPAFVWQDSTKERREESQKEKKSCHDLVKWLSQYLYFFSFSFLFF